MLFQRPGSFWVLKIVLSAGMNADAGQADVCIIIKQM
jgi:hypothetical protein